MLTVTRRSAVKARTQAANQIHSLMVCAPEPLKAQLRDLNLKAQVRVCARLRPSGESSVSYAKQALRRLARRYQTLDAEIRELDVEIKRLCATANPALLAAHGVGPDSAAALLIAAGDQQHRGCVRAHTGGGQQRRVRPSAETADVSLEFGDLSVEGLVSAGQVA